MHAAIGDETAEVQSAVAVDSPLERLFDPGDVLQLALFDGLGDAHRVLPHDAAGADVQVADLAVAHQALWQADGQRRCLELRVALGRLGALLGEVVHGRRVGGEDGVAIFARPLRGDAPAVDDDENCFLVDLGHVECAMSVSVEG
jgi:hypothetical protein